jgi:predicted nucleic acid-binding protein
VILLDTNVVSEPMRPAPAIRVVDWIDAQALETLYLSAITVAELRAGVALLPRGKRRTALHENLEQRILPLFAGRVLAFDLACTRAYAELREKLRRRGRVIAQVDGFIAAIAATHSFALATRDAAPFAAAGLEVIDPWTA